MSLNITSVTLEPQTVNTGASFLISVSITDSLAGLPQLKESTGLWLIDIDGKYLFGEVE